MMDDHARDERTILSSQHLINALEHSCFATDSMCRTRHQHGETVRPEFIYTILPKASSPSHPHARRPTRPATLLSVVDSLPLGHKEGCIGKSLWPIALPRVLPRRIQYFVCKYLVLRFPAAGDSPAAFRLQAKTTTSRCIPIPISSSPETSAQSRPPPSFPPVSPSLLQSRGLSTVSNGISADPPTASLTFSLLLAGHSAPITIAQISPSRASFCPGGPARGHAATPASGPSIRRLLVDSAPVPEQRLADGLCKTRAPSRPLTDSSKTRLCFVRVRPAGSSGCLQNAQCSTYRAPVVAALPLPKAQS